MEEKDIKDLSFEEALARLENLVRELESGRIRLDDAVTAYERAVSLKKLCENKLRDPQLKIEITPDSETKLSELDKIEN